MANSTSRLALTQPVGTDPVSELRTSITANAGTLDAAVTFSEGTLSARPAAALAGRLYYATDTGLVYHDTGSAWLTLAPVGAATPVGTIQQFAAATVPADPDGVTRWHLCDGTAISRTTYAALFTAISTTYGAGDGATTFNIPDMRGRTAIGAGSGTGLTTRTLGQQVGEENHVLSQAELASHSHGITDPGHSHGINDPTHNHASGGGMTGFVKNANSVTANGQAISGSAAGGVVTMNEDYVNASTTGVTVNGGTTGITGTGATGSDGGHNNMQPSLAVSYIIKVL